MVSRVDQEMEYKVPFLTTSKRVNKFTHEEDGESFSVTFKFPFAEEINLSKLREKLNVSDDVESNSASTLMYILRTSISDCEDILDVDKPVGDSYEPVVVAKEDGTRDEMAQKIVFEIVKSIPTLYDKVITAYIGPKGKNLKTGAMQQ